MKLWEKIKIITTSLIFAGYLSPISIEGAGVATLPPAGSPQAPVGFIAQAPMPVSTTQAPILPAQGGFVSYPPAVSTPPISTSFAPYSSSPLGVQAPRYVSKAQVFQTPCGNISAFSQNAALEMCCASNATNPSCQTTLANTTLTTTGTSICYRDANQDVLTLCGRITSTSPASACQDAAASCQTQMQDDIQKTNNQILSDTQNQAQQAFLLSGSQATGLSTTAFAAASQGNSSLAINEMLLNSLSVYNNTAKCRLASIFLHNFGLLNNQIPGYGAKYNAIMKNFGCKQGSFCKKSCTRLTCRFRESRAIACLHLCGNGIPKCYKAALKGGYLESFNNAMSTDETNAPGSSILNLKTIASTSSNPSRPAAINVLSTILLGQTMVDGKPSIYQNKIIGSQDPMEIDLAQKIATATDPKTLKDAQNQMVSYLSGYGGMDTSGMNGMQTTNTFVPQPASNATGTGGMPGMPMPAPMPLGTMGIGMDAPSSITLGDNGDIQIQGASSCSLINSLWNRPSLNALQVRGIAFPCMDTCKQEGNTPAVLLCKQKICTAALGGVGVAGNVEVQKTVLFLSDPQNVFPRMAALQSATQLSEGDLNTIRSWCSTPQVAQPVTPKVSPSTTPIPVSSSTTPTTVSPQVTQPVTATVPTAPIAPTTSVTQPAATASNPTRAVTTSVD